MALTRAAVERLLSEVSGVSTVPVRLCWEAAVDGVAGWSGALWLDDAWLYCLGSMGGLPWG